ncbi:hypothetical protein CC86DRAFT_470601 [Ophiobolus disseminans]|uniref:Uncharacterized protein n=1 Tax=Ophiobolus disseminans TaxID=1469910 RepID=A0A6A6ZL33_9PLEO|nr:hypothetical protein CC86DRAFT_470601 [Ophiobolus disseminans]
MASPISASSISCPRDGSKWYVCDTGSMFVGCCKLNPCKYGCDSEFVGSVVLTKEAFGRLPNASCSVAAEFHTCDITSAKTTFYWGCCKVNPCSLGTGCPQAENRGAFIDSLTKLKIFQNTIEPKLPTISSGATTDSSPYTTSKTIRDFTLSLTNARIVAGVALGLMVALPLAVALWIYWRHLSIRRSTRVRSPESVPFSNPSSEQQQPNNKGPINSIPNDLARVGSTTLSILFITLVVILAGTGFLSFLWLGDYTNGNWIEVMISNWATRAVSISSLLLRTAVDFQAAIATAILVSLLLESRAGVRLYSLADLSSMRSGAASPWSLGSIMLQKTWTISEKHKLSLAWVVMAISLLVTTSTLQFTSTILLSDLKPGSLGGHNFETQVRNGLSYRNITRRITRDSAWTSNPPLFPAFGEYHEPTARASNVSDTGMLLRAFLPYPTVESRQKLRSYAGKAMILDARVSCQAPQLTNIQSSGHYGEVTGVADATEQLSMLRNASPVEFDCSIAGLDEYSICQLGRTYPASVASLNSQFENSTSYGTAFLVTKGTQGGTPPLRHAEWTHINFSNQTSSGASFSLCFAPWDASILDVSMTSAANRTEPQMQWWDDFEPSNVVEHLTLHHEHRFERQILRMEKPRSFLGDLLPPSERPLVQSDASGSSAAKYGSNTPLPENWSIFLTGEPFITLLNSFSRSPKRAISADPALAAIFKETLDVTGSPAWAMSSLITVLSMTNYYSQLPAFDRLDNVTVSMYKEVLYPQQNVGLMFVLWVLVAHHVLVAVLVVLFIRKTRFTLLGNAWSAFSQMSESPEVKAYIGAASLKSDGEVVQHLKAGKHGDLRARLVNRGEAVEMTVK